MQDLAAYQSDPADADPGTTAPPATQQRTKTMLRSKSEGYSKGETTRDWLPHDITTLQWRFRMGYQVCVQKWLIVRISGSLLPIKSSTTGVCAQRLID